MTDSIDDDFRSLVDQARGGCVHSTGKLLAQCQKYLLGIANQEIAPELAGKVGASDAVQETMMEAHAAIERFDGQTEKELLVWLRTILKHNLTDLVRGFSGTQKRQINREHRLDSGWDTANGTHQTPSVAMGAEEDERRLHLAMLQLPPDHQQVIQLRNWELLTFSAIGQKMERSEEAARKLWTRAIQNLQSIMDSLERTEDEPTT